MNECCGMCKYHVYDRDTEEWYCMLEHGEYYGYVTGYDDGCSDFEDRD